MPPKRKTRAASRCKPVLANITNQFNIFDSKETERKAFLIDDFRRNITLRMEMLQEEEKQLESSLWKSYEIYRHQLLPWKNVTVQELLQYDDVDSIPKPIPQASKRDKNAIADGLGGDEFGELASSTNGNTKQPSIFPTDTEQGKISATVKTDTDGDLVENEMPQSAQDNDPPNMFAVPQSVPPKAARMSDISALIADTSKFAAVKPKKKKIYCTPAALLSATRTSSRLRRAEVPSTHLVPPSMARVSRTKKNGNTDVLVTPAGQRVPIKLGCQLQVTPKFNPRVPLPPNTQLRRPLPREVPMSVTGSPLSLSPDKPKLKAILGEFLETLEREVPSLDHKDIKQFHSVMQRHLDHKP